MKNNEQSEKKMYFKNNIVIQNRCSLVAKWIDVNAERRNRLCFFSFFLLLLNVPTAQSSNSIPVVSFCRCVPEHKKREKSFARWKVLREKYNYRLFVTWVEFCRCRCDYWFVVVVVIVKFKFFTIIILIEILINTRLQSVYSCTHIFVWLFGVRTYFFLFQTNSYNTISKPTIWYFFGFLLGIPFKKERKKFNTMFSAFTGKIFQFPYFHRIQKKWKKNINYQNCNSRKNQLKHQHVLFDSIEGERNKQIDMKNQSFVFSIMHIE